MLKQRTIACLQVMDGDLVKTIGYQSPKYIGDPINAIRIFNEKEAEELLIVDIVASRNRSEPNYALLKELANECTMPVTYVGGIRSVGQIQRIISLGIERVGLCSAIETDVRLLMEGARVVGSQSLVGIIDIKESAIRKKRYMYSYLRKRMISGDPLVRARELQEGGAGEILINCVSRDGLYTGYDTNLAWKVAKNISIPVTIMGGSRGVTDAKELHQKAPGVGAVIGRSFVLRGKHHAVLISYPDKNERWGPYR